MELFDSEFAQLLHNYGDFGVLLLPRADSWGDSASKSRKITEKRGIFKYEGAETLSTKKKPCFRKLVLYGTPAHTLPGSPSG